MGKSMRQRGQAVLETALITPILVLLIFGAFNAGVLLSDKVDVDSAARAGARLGAGIGGAQRPDASTATAAIDADIVQNVLVVANAINYASVTQITIYKPSRADGVYTAGDPADIFNGSGVQTSSTGYPLTARNQSPPNQSPLGVKVDWTYKPPLGLNTVSLTMSEYAVMKMSPVEK
jgi:Flp pilus assembly protein TadG